MSDTLLLDTNVASLLFPDKNPQSLAVVYAADLDGCIRAILFHTLAELYFWADRSNWGAVRQKTLETYIAELLILPFDLQTARIWAKVMLACHPAGRRLEHGDAWIVATAVQHNLPLVTHDRDMVGLNIDGLEIITHLK